MPSSVYGRGAFQDLDLGAAFSDVAVTSNSVSSVSDHAELMSLACKNALVKRDVAHLILPDEVQVQAAGDTPAGGPGGRVGALDIAPPSADLERAVAAVSAASRPLIIVGAGARFDMEVITALAEQLGAPVVTTFKAKGQISDRHPLGCGVLGRSGTPVASWMMNEADLIVAFGASFSNHTGIASYKPIVQVDFDPMALGRFHPVEIPLLGHVGVTATAMAEALDAHHAPIDLAAVVAERWAIWRAEKRSRLADDRGHGINSAAVFDSLTRLVDPDAVIAVDVGNNTYSFGRYFEVDSQSVLMSGYLGSIGFGFPAAMGAWTAVGDKRQIVSISGDGGFGQYAMEITTAVKYKMNITHVLLNNGELGKISKEQRAGEWDVWQTSLVNPNFAAYAELCGAKGFHVTELDQLDGAIAEGLAHSGPAVVDVIADVALI